MKASRSDPGETTMLDIRHLSWFLKEEIVVKSVPTEILIPVGGIVEGPGLEFGNPGLHLWIY